jgi:uncharacterized protein YxeA
MKKIVILYFAIVCSTAYAGGFIFPNVEYEYAKVYLFNSNEKAETDRPEFSIYMNNVYAYSKIGNGFDFTEQMNIQLNTFFRLGVDMMVAGLSGCYIPRHGIIYFDKTGKPVASISICFECQRIQFWSTKALPEFGTKYPEKNIPIIEKKFADIEALFAKNGIPVYKKTSDYISHLQTADSIYSNNGEIIFDYISVSAFNQKIFTTDDVKKWISNSNFKFKEGTETHYSQREGDTTSWRYPTLYSSDGTHIIFSNLIEQNPAMTEASILNPNIKLPNGISVGMSLDQVQASFQVWDGIAYPASIIVNYADANIRYVFESRTLRRIEVVMI